MHEHIQMLDYLDAHNHNHNNNNKIVYGNRRVHTTIRRPVCGVSEMCCACAIEVSFLYCAKSCSSTPFFYFLLGITRNSNREITYFD